MNKKAFNTIGTDFIHLTYNLFYPAVLGSFVYEAAQHLTKPIPTLRTWWFARGFLILLYCIDFIVAKKLYAARISRFHGIRLMVAILVEALTVGSLLFAYWSENDRPRFFGCLCLFGLGIMAFYLCIEPGKMNDLIAILIGLVVCLAALVLPYTEIYFRLELGALFALATTHYLLGVYSHPIVKSRISVSGSLLDQRQKPGGAQVRHRWVRSSHRSPSDLTGTAASPPPAAPAAPPPRPRSWPG